MHRVRDIVHAPLSLAPLFARLGAPKLSQLVRVHVTSHRSERQEYAVQLQQRLRNPERRGRLLKLVADRGGDVAFAQRGLDALRWVQVDGIGCRITRTGTPLPWLPGCKDAKRALDAGLCAADRLPLQCWLEARDEAGGLRMLVTARCELDVIGLQVAAAMLPQTALLDPATRASGSQDSPGLPEAIARELSASAEFRACLEGGERLRDNEEDAATVISRAWRKFGPRLLEITAARQRKLELNRKEEERKREQRAIQEAESKMLWMYGIGFNTA